MAEDEYAFDADARASIRRALGIDFSEPLYIFIGRLAADKGISRCIETMNHLGTGHLVIVGDGPAAAELRETAERSSARERVTFVGKVPTSETPNWLSAADQMWLLSDRREGLPMTLLEAAANGLPVLATPTAAAPRELIGAGIAVIEPTAAANYAVDVPIETRRSYLPSAYASETLAARLCEALAPLAGAAQ